MNDDEGIELLNDNERLQAALAAQKAQYEALKQENARLSARSVGNISIKIGDKGGLVISGFGRFPKTFYAEEWDRLYANSEMIQTFRVKHSGLLSTKDRG